MDTEEEFYNGFEAIKALPPGYEGAMTKFSRDLVRIPFESCDEKGHIDRIAEEMRAVGFDEVVIDKQGNVPLHGYR